MRGRGLREGGLRKGGLGGYVDVERVYSEGVDRFISFVFYSFTLPIISPFCLFVFLLFLFASLTFVARSDNCGVEAVRRSLLTWSPGAWPWPWPWLWGSAREPMVRST